MSYPIEALRARIEALNEPGTPFADVERLSVVTCGSLHHLEFYGTCFGDAYTDLCETLSIPSIAASILSISLRGPDEGANGTRNWDLEPLLSRDQIFPLLETFSIGLSQPGDHNRTIVASSYDEEGMITRLATRCPRLAFLTVPSAPSAEFFDVQLPYLRSLSVDAGYDTQDFLRHFGRRGRFSDLRSFEWGEYSERYMENWQESCTSFADYQALITSPAFQTVKRFVVRQATLTTEQAIVLQRLRPDIQILIVHYSSEYVRGS